MGRWKDGHRYINRIIIETENGEPALIYNLDRKGRIIYEYPVCIGLPGHIKYKEPGIYTFEPSPVQAYKKSVKKKDPSIEGCNSITIQISNSSLNKSDINEFKNINDTQNHSDLKNKGIPQNKEDDSKKTIDIPFSSSLANDINSLSFYNNVFNDEAIFFKNDQNKDVNNNCKSNSDLQSKSFFNDLNDDYQSDCYLFSSDSD